MNSTKFFITPISYQKFDEILTNNDKIDQFYFTFRTSDTQFYTLPIYL